MCENLAGVWDFESSQNFEEYLKEMGIGLVSRKAAASSKPTIYITNNGRHWSFKMQSSLKNVELEATEDVEFNESK